MSTRRFALLAASASLLLLLTTPPPAHADAIPFAGEISITMHLRHSVLVFPIAGAGGVDVSTTSGMHLAAATIPPSAYRGAAIHQTVTDTFVAPVRGIQITARNQRGSFSISPGDGALRGTMPLSGVMKVCLFVGPCPAALANVEIPISVVGQGGHAAVRGIVDLTVIGAPWTTGSAHVGTLSMRGSARGPASLPSSTAQSGGTLNLVTPIFISSTIPEASAIPAFARLVLDLGGSSACADGIDNDGDGLVDHPADPGCESDFDTSEHSGNACDDGIDNDRDGHTDYPNDPGCAAWDGETESPACDDGLDNDRDGRIDHPDDPGCAASSSATEFSECDDAIDNDLDGLVDHPQDPDCASGSDPAEGSAVCADGIDNDGDGLVDFPADSGCAQPRGRAENPACDDRLDNDLDGRVDLADTGCESAADISELLPTIECHDGIDNDGDGLFDFPDDPGCARLGAHDESPECNDARDDDGDGAIDFDGGASASGGPPLAAPDPDCAHAYQNHEYTVEPCGLGAELVAVLWIVRRLRGRGKQIGRRSERAGESPKAPSSPP